MSIRKAAAGLLLASLAAGALTLSLAQDKKVEPLDKIAPRAPARRLHDSILYRLLHHGPDRRLMTDGYRSVPVPVDEYQLSGLRAGDRVDVLSVFNATMADGKTEKLAATVLQNAKVLGVDHARDFKDRGTIHLLLNPNSAQMAVLAGAQGEIRVALRNEGDLEIYPMEMTIYRKLFR